MQMSSKESTSENGCHIASKPHTLKLNKIKKIESFQKLWAECKLVSILILWARWPARHVYRPAVWWGRQEGVREHSETVKKTNKTNNFLYLRIKHLFTSFVLNVLGRFFLFFINLDPFQFFHHMFAYRMCVFLLNSPYFLFCFTSIVLRILLFYKYFSPSFSFQTFKVGCRSRIDENINI